MAGKNAYMLEELANELRNAPEAPGGADAAVSGGCGGKQGRKTGEIFDGCPVIPLGVRGKHAYYLDALGQLRAIDNHNAQNILGLFGHFIPRLCHQFPQWEKKGDIIARKKNRFDQTTAAMVRRCLRGRMMPRTFWRVLPKPVPGICADFRMRWKRPGFARSPSPAPPNLRHR